MCDYAAPARGGFIYGIEGEQMATTSDLRTGMIIRYNGELNRVVEFQHVSPGNWRAFVRLKLQNMRTGRTVEDRVRAGSDIETVRVENREMQYLYRDGNDYVFMDNETYDQINISAEQVGDPARFLKESENVMVLSSEDDGILGVEVPFFVTLEVTETSIAVRGDTATNVTKAATLETGTEIQVPGFVNVGDKVKIDTRSGQYLERIK
jgi:elongation factor P